MTKAPKYVIWRKQGGEWITYLAITERYDMWSRDKSTAKQFTLVGARKNLLRLNKLVVSQYSSTVYGKELA
jgi:hypothetical protein